MSWEEARKAYTAQSLRASQTDEDLLARRIIGGIGLTHIHKVIGRLELRLMGNRYDDDPLFDRACRVFRQALSEYGTSPNGAQLAKRWAMSSVPAATLPEMTDAVYDQLRCCTSYKAGEWPLIFGRVANLAVGYTYSMWWKEELVELKPPFEVLPFEDRPDYRLVRQETGAFIAQFGPYRIPVVDAQGEE